MTYTFNYNMRSASFSPFFLCVAFIPLGTGLVWFGKTSKLFITEIFGLFFICFAIYLLTVGSFYLLLPKTNFLKISEHELKIYYGIPWAQKCFSVPLNLVESAEISESPFELLLLTGIAPPYKSKEDKKVVKLNLTSPLPKQLFEKMKEIKKRHLAVFHFGTNEVGTEFYIRTEPIGGWGPVVEAIRQQIKYPPNN